MGWHAWASFVAASAVIGLIPGPGVTGIVGYAIGSGRRTALASALGMAVGNAVAISASLFGVGTVLAASAGAFAAVKWAGACYLVGMGLFALWRSRGGSGSAPPADADPAMPPVTPPIMPPVTPPITPRAAFLANVAVGTLHPKTIAFFVAFVPQFIDPRGSYASQAVLLAATFCSTVLATDTCYALAASGASRWLRRPGVTTWSRRCGGGVLVAAGVATAVAER